MRRTAIIAAFGLLLPGAALAGKYQEVGSISIGPWNVQAWNDQDKFHHCSLQRTDGDIATVFARGSGGYVLALASSKWKLNPKASYPVRLVGGAALNKELQAEVADANTVTIRLGDDEGLIDGLKKVQTLDVRAASGTIRAPFDQGGSALTELETCWRERTRTAAAENDSNPFAAKSEDTTNPFASGGKALPAKPSLEDYSRLMNRVAGRPVKSTVDKDGDFETAHMGNIKTMFSSREGADSIDKLAEAFLNGAKPSCKGAPQTGTVTRDESGSIQVQRVYLACTMSAPVYIDTVIVTDGSRFQSYSTLGLQKERTDIMRISQAILEEVKKAYD